MSTRRSGIPRQFTATAPLSAAEELALAREHVRSRSPASAHRLVCSHLRLVLKIAREYRVPAHAELSDVVQDGTLGLLEAVRRFDPERGVRLFTYASWWIRAYILRGIVNTAEIVCSGRGRKGRRDFFAGRRPPPALSLDAPAATGGIPPCSPCCPRRVPRPPIRRWNAPSSRRSSARSPAPWRTSSPIGSAPSSTPGCWPMSRPPCPSWPPVSR